MVYIIVYTYRYSDDGNNGIEGVFRNKEEAEKRAKYLNEVDGDSCKYSVEEFPLN